MTLHVFNPQHDMALAANQWQFTAPKAGRQLASELDYLPALWAKAGDAVLVQDISRAKEMMKELPGWQGNILPVSHDQLAELPITKVMPWGWDRSIVHDLLLTGIRADIFPGEMTLDAIREVSHRRWAAERLLPLLLDFDDLLLGEATFFDHLPTWERSVVLKAPWSCSGRGVRYALDAEQWERQRTWALQVIQKQGGIMVEPYYNKVCDLAMEFDSFKEGVVYRGLSIFCTHHGDYAGNIIDTERQMLSRLSRYVPATLLEKIKLALVEYMCEFLRPIYIGPFGIDMMVVEKEGKYLLHPCVELNLRMTMGRVAISMTRRVVEKPRLMAIEYNEHYSFNNYLITNDNDKEIFFTRDVHRPDDVAGAEL